MANWLFWLTYIRIYHVVLNNDPSRYIFLNKIWFKNSFLLRNFLFSDCSENL